MTKARHFKTINGHKWAYLKWGKGRPIFIFHGVLTSAECIDELANRLKKNFTVIAPDLPGYGLTPVFHPNDYHAMTMDAIPFIKSFGYQQVDLLGFSLGATVVLDICINEPKLVYTAFPISPFWKKEYVHFNFLEKLEFALAAVPGIVEQIKQPKVLRSLFKVAVLIKQDLKKILPKHETLFLNTIRQSDIEGTKEVLASVQDHDLTLGLKKPFPRTLLLNGENDPLILKEYTMDLAKIIDMPLLIVKGEDHEIIVDAPNKLARIVNDYVLAGKITEDPELELFKGD